MRLGGGGGHVFSSMLSDCFWGHLGSALVIYERKVKAVAGNQQHMAWAASALPLSSNYRTITSRMHTAQAALYSLVPRPSPFFVLRFAFSIIHGSGRAQRKPKNRKKMWEAWERGYIGTVCLSRTPSTHSAYAVRTPLGSGQSENFLHREITLVECFSYSKCLKHLASSHWKSNLDVMRWK